jgi:hypothetical protein
MRRSRVPVVGALCALMVVVVAGGASADPNPRSGRIPVTAPPDEVVTGICPFPVLVETVVNNEFSKTLPDGTVLVSGRLVVRVTNTVTGESKVYNVSGPAKITTNGAIETDVFLGPGLGIDPSIGMIVTSGRVVVTVNTETGELRIVSQRGHVEDVCATLAA